MTNHTDIRKSIDKVKSVYYLYAIFVLCLAIPAIYYGFSEEDHPCQQGLRGGLTLSDWTKGYGLYMLTVLLLLPVIACASIAMNSSAVFGCFGPLILADIFFWVIWEIMGVVILVTPENRKCVSEGTGMAVSSIFCLIFGGARFMFLKLT